MITAALRENDSASFRFHFIFVIFPHESLIKKTNADDKTFLFLSDRKLMNLTTAQNAFFRGTTFARSYSRSGEGKTQFAITAKGKKSKASHETPRVVRTKAVTNVKLSLHKGESHYVTKKACERWKCDMT